MSEFIPIGHCGKENQICFPKLCDDLCIGCPINGWDDENYEDEEGSLKDCTREEILKE